MSMRNRVKNFMNKKQDGLGVIEIILIIVVLIGLVLIFRGQIEKLIGEIGDMISQRVKGL